MKLQKTEIEGIYRESSGALINNDMNSLIVYKKKKRAQVELENFMRMTKENQEKINFVETLFKNGDENFYSIQNEIQNVKKDLLEIKNLLSKITKK
jgi:hypothetical protein